MKRRGRGRPGRGAEPMQVVAVCLTAEELEALDAATRKHEMAGPRPSGPRWLVSWREGPPECARAWRRRGGCRAGR